ncbi:periplasmic protein [Herbaspirillum hiltneri N3]|uniref:Periplasmic protein n=1 Tax=Herbaspirillum hiltneri N3 TaxID=1262470 RepID=A0ABM5UWG8_9BURK|nr:chalcone isomerase family protein [Herbaspirillum hiltneri]AKZ61556.1 periplasmic protein [Herbaspirillum hiltneri N3]
MRAFSRRSLVTCLLLAATWSAGAAQAAGWRDDLSQAHLQGSAGLRWFGLKIYDAALWSGTTPFDPAQPFALELTYRRSISRTRIVQTSMDEIRRLFGDRYSEEQLQRWEADMMRAFVDVNEGDQLTGVYLPGVGCRFYSRTRLLAEVRDAEFARAFFAIWLDPRTRDTQLRDRLLGAEK